MGHINLHSPSVNGHRINVNAIEVPNDTPVPRVQTPPTAMLDTCTPVPRDTAPMDDLGVILEQDLNDPDGLRRARTFTLSLEHASNPFDHVHVAMPPMHKATESAYDDNHNVVNLYSNDQPLDVSLEKFKSIVRYALDINMSMDSRDADNVKMERMLKTDINDSTSSEPSPRKEIKKDKRGNVKDYDDSTSSDDGQFMD